MASTAEKLDPELWEEAKADAREKFGGHSARAMQYAVKLYKERGGRYKGRKKADNRLTQWTEQDWTTKSGEPSRETGERYLPRAAIESLTPAEYGATSRAKRAGGGVGKVVAQPQSIREKTRKFRKVNPDMATPAQIAARKQFAERARSGELAKMRKKTTKRNPMPTKARAVKSNPSTNQEYALVADQITAYAKARGGIDKNDFMKAARILKKGDLKAAKNFAATLDSDPRDFLLSMMDNLRQKNPTATRAPARPRTKLISNGREKNPSSRDVFFVNVIDDGGFIYGMDDRTPVTFRFSNRELTRGVYRSFALPYAVTSNPAFQAYAKSLPQGLTVMSLAQLKNKLRDFA